MQATFSKSVGELLGSRLERLESASLRHRKFLFLGENGQKDQLVAVADLARRHSRLPVWSDDDCSFDLRLGGRMMVDMATGVLENSGMALHRHFNCPYIPGSALKGIARHAAWCEWKSAPREIRKSLEQLTARIFGSPVSESGEIENSQGSVVFMDTFPANRNWSLVVDVLNPHGENDYNNPVPCFFLAVEKGAAFRFVLRSLKTGSSEDEKQAGKWLRCGLAEHGVGAKTIAGYGWFEDDSHFEAKIDVELISPGFFGGASHNSAADTILRAPSLRGMLRWWWRTLYRDLLEEYSLQKLEDALWGSTSSSGWIRTRVFCETPPKVELFNYKDRFNPKPDFARKHQIDERHHGLFYMAYGMDEKSHGEAKQRFYCASGSRWSILFSIRNNADSVNLPCGGQLSSEQLIQQAEAALSLLCRYGGIGSKSRNGFGSLQWTGAMSLEECRTAARTLFGKTEQRKIPYSWSMAVVHEVEIPCKDAWTVLDRLGIAVKSFAAEYKHQDEKAALGLPRKIHGPLKGKLMKHQSWESHSNPENLMPNLKEAQNGNKTRFASPVWFHLEKAASGMLIRMTAFPSAQIRKLSTSERMLEKLLEQVAESLLAANWQVERAPHRSNPAPRRSTRSDTRSSMGGLVAGQEVRAVLLEEKTKKGGWKVQVVGTSYKGPVINHTEISENAGDEITVVINSANPYNPSFRYKKP